MGGEAVEKVGAEAEQVVEAAPVGIVEGGLSVPALGFGPSSAGGLSRLPPRQRADALARLNAGGGNTAVAAVIARVLEGLEPGPAGKARRRRPQPMPGEEPGVGTGEGPPRGGGPPSGAPPPRDDGPPEPP